MEKGLEINNLQLTPKEQENLRKKIVRTAKKNLTPTGKLRVKVVSEICECSESHVKTTWKKYRTNGVNALQAVKMGRPKNSGTLLDQKQETKIIEMITLKNPEQLRLPGCLWDRKLVAELVLRVFNVKMQPSTMGHYLRKWGFTAQRPKKKHYKQNPKEVQKWLEVEYPAIAEAAKEENATINWIDETGISNESGCIKGYSPKGQTPVLAVGNHKIRVNMISAITNQGKLRFHFYRDKMNQQLYIGFLEKLIKTTDSKVYAIADNLKVHHGKIVKEWAKENSDKIKLFYLPSYSPELNPDEYMNNNLKTELAKRGFSKDADAVQAKAMSVMRSISRSKNRVKNFFDKEEVRYAR